MFLQLSELEQRVLEAEGRAEEAEDKVSVIFDAFYFGGRGSSSLLCNALAFIAFIDYFPSRRECPWTWRLSADRTTRNWYSFLFGILLFFMLFCWWAVFFLLNRGINSWENVSCTHEFYNTTHWLCFFLLSIFLLFSWCALLQSQPASLKLACFEHTFLKQSRNARKTHERDSGSLDNPNTTGVHGNPICHVVSSSTFSGTP